ncbi:hypothetical protein PG994_009285 [Apiospora phragmitis]|uniref:NADP-dependent oxidoreductase domain-containing protein n=1 Tax=Apiospora phragmitis TaxID=2905665 RepID=A0ABR1UJF2_9PEZI
MADHYGEAEAVVGQFNASWPEASQRLTAFTKWCPPEDEEKSYKNARAAVNRALSRMDQKSIALMQYHIWDYEDDTCLYNLAHLQPLQQLGRIQNIGLTQHRRGAPEEVPGNGLPHRHKPVAILAYGTLLGGFLTEKWLGVDEPQDVDALNWSLRKYLRFIHAAGGWVPFQRVLSCLAHVAQKHGVSIPAVAI